MTLSDFQNRLLSTGQTLGWDAQPQPEYVSRSFRDRDDDISPLPPGVAVGLQLGDYPILVSTIRLEDRAALEKTLKALHGQMVIARSFMDVNQIINAHILLCATETGAGDWKAVIDIAERDEAVCRKLIWMPDRHALDDSYASFVDRTFLAQPWTVVDTVTDAHLDHNKMLVQRALVNAGLKPEEAAKWEAILKTHESDPETLAAKLTDLMERKQ